MRKIKQERKRKVQDFRIQVRERLDERKENPEFVIADPLPRYDEIFQEGLDYLNHHSEGLKICSKCKLEKSAMEFSKNRSKKDSLKSCCKQCEKQYRERPEVNARHKKYMKNYYKKFKQRLLKQNKQYRERPEIKERTSKRKKEYYQKPEVRRHKLCMLKQYYYENDERRKKIIQRNHQYLKTPKGKERTKNRVLKDVRQITDRYIKSLIRNAFGLKNSQISIGMIEFRRQIVRIHRKLKQFKEEINYVNSD